MNLSPPVPTDLLSKRKRELLEHVEATVDDQKKWRTLNSVYYGADRDFMRFLIPPGKRVLELGCGRGDLLAHLFDRGFAAEGIEPSEESARVSRERFAGNPLFRGVASTPSDLADGSFDRSVPGAHPVLPASPRRGRRAPAAPPRSRFRSRPRSSRRPRRPGASSPRGSARRRNVRRRFATKSVGRRCGRTSARPWVSRSISTRSAGRCRRAR